MATDYFKLLLDAMQLCLTEIQRHEFTCEVLGGPGKRVEFEVDGKTHRISHYNSAGHFDLDTENFLRFELYNKTQRLCGHKTARLENLRNQSLGERLNQQVLRLHKGETPEALPRKKIHNPGANAIFGRVVYHGELTLGKSASKCRGLLEAFTAYAILYSYARWRQDFSWCILRGPTHKQSLGYRVHMAHQYRMLQRWSEMPPIRERDDCLAFNAAEDIVFLARTILEENQ